MLNKNDVVQITRKFRSPLNREEIKTEVFVAVLNWVEERDFGLYVGYTPEDTANHGAWGTLRIENEPKWHTPEVKVIGNRVPVCLQPSNGWMYGHPSFDLLHDAPLRPVRAGRL